MATSTKETVPEVYIALGKILAAMSVEKNGTLPGNMGGKPYITAVDASAETKRQFVANNLVILPSEKIIKHEVVIHKDRIAVAIAVEGTYRVVSTVDGSQDTFSGSGDGLANGTAVASNIASTNALKNALLRTFLITEQSVEDSSKNGVSDGPADQAKTPVAKKLDAARANGPSKAPATGDKAEVDRLRSAIKERFLDTGEYTNIQVNALWDTIAKEKGSEKSTVAVVTELGKRLAAGEVG